MVTLAQAPPGSGAKIPLPATPAATPQADALSLDVGTLTGMADAEWNVERHLLGKPPEVVALYHHFARLVSACGPFSIEERNHLQGYAPGFRRCQAQASRARRIPGPAAARRGPSHHPLQPVHQPSLRAPVPYRNCQPARRRVRRLDSRGLPGRRRTAGLALDSACDRAEGNCRRIDRPLGRAVSGLPSWTWCWAQVAGLFPAVWTESQRASLPCVHGGHSSHLT